MILSGHPRLVHRLTLQKHMALLSRFQLRAHLNPFTQDESMQYMQHDLNTAGAIRPIFTEAALKKLHQSTGGNARSLNNISTLCLMSAAIHNLDLIDDTPGGDVVAAETREHLMTATLRPTAHEVRALQTPTTVTSLIDTKDGNTLATELDEQSFWSVLEPFDGLLGQVGSGRRGRRTEGGLGADTFLTQLYGRPDSIRAVIDYATEMAVSGQAKMVINGHEKSPKMVSS